MTYNDPSPPSSPPSSHELQKEHPLYLDQLSTTDLAGELFDETRPYQQHKAVVLLPLGSVEPHGPHMPLSTDRLLSEESAERATHKLRREGVNAWIAPSLAYGVTEFASGFCGAITLSQSLYEQLLIELTDSYIKAGFIHVCWINHHLEPKQLSAIKNACEQAQKSHGIGAVSAPSVLSRRWGRALGAEFRSGACHAGAYEGSMVIHSHPQLFQTQIAQELPAVQVSLSQAIKEGRRGFLDAGMDQAYTGTPAQSTSEEGRRLYECHAEMIYSEVTESLLLITHQNEQQKLEDH